MPPHTFHVGVKAVLVNPKTKKALVLKATDAKYLDLPGGRIGGFESVEEALARELNEEIGITNLQINLQEPLLVYRVQHDIKENIGLVLIYYKINTDFSDIKLSNEHTDCQWINRTELEDLHKSGTIVIEKGTYDALKMALISLYK